MRVKELKRTVNVSWSPVDVHPACIAAGSAAQQVDSSFSTSSLLEIYSLNLEDPGTDLELKCSVPTQHKFHKIVWSGAGVIVGGCDGGLLEFYSSEKLLKNDSSALIASSSKHNGHVSALDINPFQKNLLASGASESEIFIWDLNNTTQPMAPGNRSQPLDHVQGLAWNQQVQHILGSTFATRCVVWDLRKNEPIMKLSDAQSRTRWRALAWHPNVATQLCVASEDDQAPVVQLWDLRLAASPLVTLEGHQKGVMALSWCKQDPDLLLSAGKDGRVLCWNPNNTRPGGELLCEISSTQQWVFDVSWCERNPALFAHASFDQRVVVHSLFGGSQPDTTAHNQSNILDSFGAASLQQLPTVSRTEQKVVAPQLPKPPQWMQRPAAAKFSFGGKLVTFEKCPQEENRQKLVYVSQVVSDPDIVENATELDTILGSSLSQDPQATERLAEYCRQKGDAAMDQSERYTWFFLRANFLPSFRTEVLNLLGFKQDEIPSKFKSSSQSGDIVQPTSDLMGLSRGESTETEAELSTDTSTDLSDAHTLIERKLANLDLGPSVNNITIPSGEDATSLICRALVCGNLEEAVELCLQGKRIADALVIASLGSQELLYKVQKYHLNHTASDPVSLLSGSLLLSRWDTLVQATAASNWKEALAALVTHCDTESLAHYCEMLGDKLSKESDPNISQASVYCYLCAMSPAPLLGRARADTTKTLARLTELALLSRRAAKERGRGTQNSKELDAILIEYASRLASQGCLQSALNSLEGVPDCELKDRLMHALGLLRVDNRRGSQMVNQRARSISNQSQQRPHMQRNDISNSYNQAPAVPYEANPWGAPGYSQPSLPAQQPPVLPPQASVARPSSRGPTGGLTSRSKYKVDPSVAAAPSYNQYSYNTPNTSQAYSYNSPIPDQYNSSSVPANQPMNPLLNPGLNPINPGFSSINPGLNPINPALNPINPVNPINSNPMAPINPMNPVAPNANMNGSYYTPQAPVEQAPIVAPPSKPAAPGWNDPPMMSSKPKPKPEPVTSQAPITHPLFGVEPPQIVPLNPQYDQYGQQTPYPQQYAPPAAQYGQQQFVQGQYGQQYQQFQQNQYPQTMSPAYPAKAASPAPAVEAAPKPPLPAEFAQVQQVLDDLRQQCADNAPNPQTKRKLEDVQRRLENLYDVLREQTLSESGQQSLQNIASCVQTGQFSAALQECTSLATGADFARAAAFLPGLKLLLQLAGQTQHQSTPQQSYDGMNNAYYPQVAS